jgi:DNA-binding winged helix-turn-helix (wHTH) protein/alpha-beta hydrolase superfamily lysophospholipase
MTYLFGSYELNLDSQQLLCDGVPQDIEPQVFDLLKHMIENVGQLVSQDDLIEAVWRGRIVSDSAISARISAARSAVGDSGSKQEVIKTVPRKGFRFIAAVKKTGGQTSKASTEASPVSNAQRVRFCKSMDGTRIGYAMTGEGYPLLRSGHWLTHLEHDWHSPIWRPLLDELGGSFAVTRYDQRGNGLSDLSINEFTLEKCVEDMEAVVGEAGLEKFALYGASQGAPISVAYAVRHPEKVSHLILLGGFAQGRMVRESEEEKEQGEALLTLLRHGWGKPGSAFLKGFSSMIIPGGTQIQITSLVDLQKNTTTAENALLIRKAVDRFDVMDLLDQVSAPTLILHARNDSVHPLEQGQVLAVGIKDAQFVMLESDNHIILEHEPAWNIMFNEIRDFVATK